MREGRDIGAEFRGIVIGRLRAEGSRPLMNTAREGEHSGLLLSALSKTTPAPPSAARFGALVKAWP